MLEDDISAVDRVINYVSPKRKGVTYEGWQRIKKVLAELAPIATNDGSPKLPPYIKFGSFAKSCGLTSQQAMDVHAWFEGQLSGE